MGIAWFSPAAGAVVSALIAGMIIGYVSLYAHQREDTVIGAIWAIGMALGLLFLTKTPGYVEPMSYLFGNILLISKNDLLLIALLDVVIITLGTLFYNKFLAVCFDEEFARLRGIRVGVHYLLLLCLISLTVVLMVTIVGIVLVIALLTLPSAVAGILSKKLWQMMVISSILCMLFTVIGLGLSYIYDLPTGSNIILVAGAVYLMFVFGSRFTRSKNA
jgi:zinc transport system permease protein